METIWKASRTTRTHVFYFYPLPFEITLTPLRRFSTANIQNINTNYENTSNHNVKFCEYFKDLQYMYTNLKNLGVAGWQGGRV